MGSNVILPAPGQPKTGPDANFKQGSVPNLVTFQFEEVAPPSAIYIQRDDVLVIEGATQVSPEVLTITARILLPYAQAAGQPDQLPAGGVAGGPIVGPGYIQTLQRTLSVPLNLSNALLGIQLLEGYLLSIAVTAAVATNRGDTFVRVWLHRGAVVSQSPNVFFPLLADYVTAFAMVGWPEGRLLSPTDGAGRLVRYTIGNPAAGSDFTITSSSAGRVRVRSMKATFTASATVANRFPSFQLGSAVEFQVQDTAADTASQVVTYSLCSGGTSSRGGGNPIFVVAPLPGPAIERPSAVLASSTQGIQVGDQWSAISLDTEEWMDNL